MGKSTASGASTRAASVDTSGAIALANPQGALNQFQLAADQIESQYPGALSAFQSYVSGGTKGALDQQAQAQLATLPVSSTATAALDELRGFLGLPSISPTAGLSTTMNKLIGQMSTIPEAANEVSQLSNIRDQLNQAESIEDPVQREQVKADITQQMNNISGRLNPEFATQLQGIQKQFDVGYGKDAGSAWSPEVVQAKLEATPGYQFRMNQGMKALERSAAAKGNLLSGNTLAAAQEFGQGLASQEYGNTINRLQNAVATQAPGLSQQAGLLQGAGGYLNQAGQQQGAAAGDIYKGIAGAGQQAYNLGGQGLLQSGALQGQMAQQGALSNAQMQQQANVTNAQLQQQANLANQQTQANPGLLNSLLASQIKN